MAAAGAQEQPSGHDLQDARGRASRPGARPCRTWPRAHAGLFALHARSPAAMRFSRLRPFWLRSSRPNSPIRRPRFASRIRTRVTLRSVLVYSPRTFRRPGFPARRKQERSHRRRLRRLRRSHRLGEPRRQSGPSRRSWAGPARLAVRVDVHRTPLALRPDRVPTCTLLPHHPAPLPRIGAGLVPRQHAEAPIRRKSHPLGACACHG
jgi:hypothetical protein